MAELPGGTVTLVFTDIEGSSRLLNSLGSRYEAVLADHRRLLRTAFRSHHGIEVDTQGDAFFYAFARAHDALIAAVEAQRALASHDFGEKSSSESAWVHSGEPTVTQEGYVGPNVHLGARICAAAWGSHAGPRCMSPSVAHSTSRKHSRRSSVSHRGLSASSR